MCKKTLSYMNIKNWNRATVRFQFFILNAKKEIVQDGFIYYRRFFFLFFSCLDTCFHLRVSASCACLFVFCSR